MASMSVGPLLAKQIHVILTGSCQSKNKSVLIYIYILSLFVFSFLNVVPKVPSEERTFGL